MEELAKNKTRGLRRDKTETAVDRQVAINRQHRGAPLARGFFKKHHAMDCGKPRCGLCGNVRRRSPKLKDRLTIQELRAEQETQFAQAFWAEASRDSTLTFA